MNTLIREADHRDIPILARINRQSHQENYTSFAPKAYLDYMGTKYEAFWEGLLAKKLYRSRIWLLEVDQVPVGCCAAALAEYHPDEYYASVDALFLIKEYMGRGLGRLMLNQCSEYIYNDLAQDGFYILVQEENANARGFYEAVGGKLINFHKTTRYTNYNSYTCVSYGYKKEK